MSVVSSSAASSISARVCPSGSIQAGVDHETAAMPSTRRVSTVTCSTLCPEDTSRPSSEANMALATSSRRRFISPASTPLRVRCATVCSSQESASSCTSIQSRPSICRCCLGVLSYGVTAHSVRRSCSSLVGLSFMGLLSHRPLGCATVSSGAHNTRTAETAHPKSGFSISAAKPGSVRAIKDLLWQGKPEASLFGGCEVPGPSCAHNTARVITEHEQNQEGSMPKPRCAHCGAFTKPFSRNQLAAVESEITLLVRDELKKAYPNKG